MTTNVIDAIREKEADAHAEREEAFAERNRLNQAFFDGKLIAYAEVLRLLGEDLEENDGYATCATIARGIPTTKSSCSEEDSVPDERIEKAAIAVFAAQTNWAEPNSTQKTVKALWDGQMDAVRDSFRRLAKAALDSLEDRPADLDWENADRGWTAEELDDDSGEPAAHGPYARYSLQAVEEVPWKPASDDSTPIHEGSRTVHLPDVRSFGRLEQDKWLAVKNLEESAELVEACKQWLKACDPADPSGIDGQFIGVVNCLNIHGAAVGDEPDIDLDKAKAGWIGYVRDQRRQAMLGELADVLQTVGNLITAFDITDEELAQSMDDCLVRNQERGRL